MQQNNCELVQSLFPEYYMDELEQRLQSVQSSISQLEETLEQSTSAQIDLINRAIKQLINETPYQDVRQQYLQLVDKNQKLDRQYIVGNDERVSEFYSIEFPKLYEVVTKIEQQQQQYDLDYDCVMINVKKYSCKVGAQEYRKSLINLYRYRGNRILKEDVLLLFFHDFMNEIITIRIKLMLMDGPLSVSMRYYVALLAVSSNDDQFSIQYLKEQYMNYGGDASWLTKDGVPDKIKKLKQINQILNHQPWLLADGSTFNTIQQQMNEFSKSEIIHAIIIMIFHQCLSSMNLSNGLVAEQSQCSQQQPVDFGEEQPVYNDKMILNYLKNYKKNQDQPANQQQNIIKEDIHLMTFNQQKQQFQYLKDQQQIYNKSQDILGDLIYDLQDFNFKQYKFHQESEFFWNDAFELIRLFDHDIAESFDKLLKVAFETTNNSFQQNEDIDTYPFRNAIWKYSQLVLGINYPNYDYQEVNNLLQIEIKNYIKMTIRNPWNIKLNDFKIVASALLSEVEMIQLSIVSISAKMQTQLVYAFLALQQLKNPRTDLINLRKKKK